MQYRRFQATLSPQSRNQSYYDMQTQRKRKYSVSAIWLQLVRAVTAWRDVILPAPQYQGCCNSHTNSVFIITECKCSNELIVLCLVGYNFRKGQTSEECSEFDRGDSVRPLCRFPPCLSKSLRKTSDGMYSFFKVYCYLLFKTVMQSHCEFFFLSNLIFFFCVLSLLDVDCYFFFPFCSQGYAPGYPPAAYPPPAYPPPPGYPPAYPPPPPHHTAYPPAMPPYAPPPTAMPPYPPPHPPPGYPPAPASPPGGQPSADLFVFHLPNEADDNLLYRLFSPHGAIISAKVATHTGTNKCKGTCFYYFMLFTVCLCKIVPSHSSACCSFLLCFCVGFGFVKMANWMNAYNAIQALNGFKIENKYLSVSFKK